jgi:hypothetical protein
VEFLLLRYRYLYSVTRDEWRLADFSSLTSKTERLLEDALAGSEPSHLEDPEMSSKLSVDS